MSSLVDVITMLPLRYNPAASGGTGSDCFNMTWGRMITRPTCHVFEDDVRAVRANDGAHIGLCKTATGLVRKIVVL